MKQEIQVVIHGGRFSVDGSDKGEFRLKYDPDKTFSIEKGEFISVVEVFFENGVAIKENMLCRPYQWTGPFKDQYMTIWEGRLKINYLGTKEGMAQLGRAGEYLRIPTLPALRGWQN